MNTDGTRARLTPEEMNAWESEMGAATCLTAASTFIQTAIEILNAPGSTVAVSLAQSVKHLEMARQLLADKILP